MIVIFLGVGEAVDKNLANNSHIVISEKTNLLLDCGYSIPQELWKYNEDPDFLDAIYISHQHADHYFGLPAILLRMWEDGRRKKLKIICPKSINDSFSDFINCAYNGMLKKIKFKISLTKSEEKKNIKVGDLKLSFEKTIHPVENLAIKITNKKTLCYSGDGLPLKNTNFYKNIDLLIQETFMYDIEIVGHASIVGAIKFAEKNNIKSLALTHIDRNLRKNELFNLRYKIKSDNVNIMIPQPFEEYNI